MISVPSVPSEGFFGDRAHLRFPICQAPPGVQKYWSSWEVFFRLAEVKLQEGETLENALRRFKRKVQQEDIIKEVKRHSFYLKPGEKRRVKQALARKRNRKKSRREIE